MHPSIRLAWYLHGRMSTGIISAATSNTSMTSDLQSGKPNYEFSSALADKNDIHTRIDCTTLTIFNSLPCYPAREGRSKFLDRVCGAEFLVIPDATIEKDIIHHGLHPQLILFPVSDGMGAQTMRFLSYLLVYYH